MLSRENLLIEAIRAENQESVDDLLEKKASPDDTKHLGTTPLMWAARGNSKDILRLLLGKGGAIIDEENKLNGDNPLIEAARKGRVENVRILLEAKANIQHKNVRGDTALITAVSSHHPKTIDVLSLLLEKRADIDHQAGNHDTALIKAACCQQTEIVRFLIENNAQTELEDKRGDTALTWAAYQGATDILILLLCAGANLHHKNHLEHDALSEAISNNHQEIIAAIEEELEAQKTYQARIDTIKSAFQFFAIQSNRFGEIPKVDMPDGLIDFVIADYVKPAGLSQKKP